MNLARWMLKKLCSVGCEDGLDPPGSECRLEFGELDADHGYPIHVATTGCNDGHELWIAYRHGKWQFHCWAKDARQLAWWILWDWWAKATWFGLKRKLWYWALHRDLEDIRRAAIGGSH